MNAVPKTTLGLQLPTDPRWAGAAQMKLEDILTDHAYCEQKAASSMISMIQMHPEREDIVDALAPIVSEEWGHFRAVLAQIKKRGFKLGMQRKDDYVKLLQQARHKGGDRKALLLDQLLMCAMIEARSCERFRVLSLELEDQELAQFYHGFMVAEAGHYKLFIKLAKQYFTDEEVADRWQYWLDYEAEIMKQYAARPDRMH